MINENYTDDPYESDSIRIENFRLSPLQTNASKITIDKKNKDNFTKIPEFHQKDVYYVSPRPKKAKNVRVPKEIKEYSIDEKFNQ